MATANVEEMRTRVSALLDEIHDLLKPSAQCDDPECKVDHSDCPDGPWMISGWVIAVDFQAEGKDGDLETWTKFEHSKNLPRTQALGLAMTIANLCGG